MKSPNRPITRSHQTALLSICRLQHPVYQYRNISPAKNSNKVNFIDIRCFPMHLYLK
ncbi:MAG: hypothetical protein KBD43_10975 [Saprospiraceae bacterium]|nr:hypothetical protein [Saprospiraceae bacterium]